MMDGLAVGHTLRNWAIMLHRDPIHDMTLLGLVPQSARFYQVVLWGGGGRGEGGGRWARRAELAILSAAQPEKKAHYARLLLPLYLLDVLLSTHFGLILELMAYPSARRKARSIF